MMGVRQVAQEAVFYEFRIERHVPAGLLLNHDTCVAEQSANLLSTRLAREAYTIDVKLMRW